MHPRSLLPQPALQLRLLAAERVAPPLQVAGPAEDGVLGGRGVARVASTVGAGGEVLSWVGHRGAPARTLAESLEEVVLGGVGGLRVGQRGVVGGGGSVGRHGGMGFREEEIRTETK